MFDILPASAVPNDVEIASDLLEAKIKARGLFKDLQLSPERDSILAALGRLGKTNLKQKVRSRAQRIIDELSTRLPNLISVLDQAIDCRNYFVHGGEVPPSYNRDSDVSLFFTDTLEFAFAVSDLIEAGWDIKTWMAGTSVSHPFGRYLLNYHGQLVRFGLQPNTLKQSV